MKTFFSGAIILFSLIGCSAQSSNAALKAGDDVPRFSLYDQDNRLFNVTDFLGKKILIIYFYPKDESPVCTKEACAFRDQYDEFVKAGAMVIGINSGTVQSHQKFISDDHLPFILLSDSNNVVLKKFRVKNKFGISGRETFVVDLSGKIVFTYDSMIEGANHADQTLKYVLQHEN